MPFTPDSAAVQVQERLKAIYTLVQDVEKKRSQNEQGISNIVKFQKNQDDKTSQHYQMKLKGLLKTAVTQAEQEEDLLRKALQKITEIRTIKNERRLHAKNAGNKETIRRGALMKMLELSAQTLPLYVSKVGEKVPVLCGATPADAAYYAKVGDMVAALVKGTEGEENWILAEAVSFNTSTSKYEVDDIDEEQNQKDRHLLSKRRVVPLPLMRANPETDANLLFAKGTVVMALYPQTTCFYKAIINQLPVLHTDEYEVFFEDASYEDGYSPPLCVAQRYVINTTRNGQPVKIGS